MRIITLNAWGGRSLYPLMRFLRQRKDETDAFCFQEIFDADPAALRIRYPGEHLCADLYRRIRDELDDFHGAFARFENEPNRMSLAVFVRKDLPIVAIDDFIVHVPAKPMDDGKVILSSRKLQTVRVAREGGDLLIANFHGLWIDGPKTDTPDRLRQSREVAEALKRHAGPRILCGDFNLLPGTESLRILEVEASLRNLVRDCGAASTRTPLYRHYANPAEPNFADYVLSSHGLAVKRFDVLPDIVSDHAPLRAEFV